jgi:hypothetical protein
VGGFSQQTITLLNVITASLEDESTPPIDCGLASADTDVIIRNCRSGKAQSETLKQVMKAVGSGDE